jgi:enterochelin esterase-like enzyme
MMTLLERARREGTPVIEPDRAIFVWEGADPPALMGDFNDWDPDAGAIRLAEESPGVWMYALPLPPDAYIEYTFVRGGERISDPLNPHTIWNGVDADNHYFSMPAAESTPLVRVARGTPRGLVTRHIIEDKGLLLGGRRAVYLYHPPVDTACPLIVVFDGQDYLRRARLTAIMDNLIARRRIRPVALAMVNHAGQGRVVEYMMNDVVVGYVMMHVLPLAHAHLNLVDLAASPGAYGLLGASMGGLIALYTALRVPEVFGHVLSQSCAADFGSPYRVPALFELIRHLPPRPLKVWMDVGQYEWLLEANRRLHTLLRERGYDVIYREYAGGHNYTAWRNDIWRGLEALYDKQG